MIIGCYARLSLQRDAKNVSMFQNIRLFLSRRGHYIGRKTPHPFTPCPAGDKMFSLTGRETTFFRTDFSKKRILHFYIPLGE
jgi:hypothetical protein